MWPERPKDKDEEKIARWLLLHCLLDDQAEKKVGNRGKRGIKEQEGLEKKRRRKRNICTEKEFARKCKMKR
jgi:hypothetical protein